MSEIPSVDQRPTATPEQTSLLKIKNFLTKTGEFLRENWRAIATAVAFIFVFALGFFETRRLANANQEMKSLLSETRAAHLQDMRQLSESFERQRLAQERIETEFKVRIEELDRNYQEQLSRVSQTRRARQRQIEENPSELPRTFESVFGIPGRQEQ